MLTYFRGKSFPLGGELLPDRVISLQRVRKREGEGKIFIIAKVSITQI